MHVSKVLSVRAEDKETAHGAQPITCSTEQQKGWIRNKVHEVVLRGVLGPQRDAHTCGHAAEASGVALVESRSVRRHVVDLTTDLQAEDMAGLLELNNREKLPLPP